MEIDTRTFDIRPPRFVPNLMTRFNAVINHPALPKEFRQVLQEVEQKFADLQAAHATCPGRTDSIETLVTED